MDSNVTFQKSCGTDDQERKLKEKILRSGFPLEIKVASALMQDFPGMCGDVSTSPYYLDKDEGKGRELDVKALLFTKSKSESPAVFINLLIECKNVQGNSWIFYNSPYVVDHFSHYYETSVLRAIGWNNNMAYNLVYKSGLHFRHLPITILNDEFVIDKKKSNGKSNNLFEAIVTVVKASGFEFEEENRSLKETAKDDAENLDYVNLYFPVIVSNAKMFLVDQVEKGQGMELTSINNIGCYVDYISGNYNLKLLVEVINENFLKQYFSEIKKDLELLAVACDGQDGLAFQKEVAKAAAWFKGRKR